jgi:single-stranded-DNA-specific exonuclease
MPSLAPENSELLKEYPALLAHLLYDRGIRTKEEADRFLQPNFERDTYDPMLLHDMEKACVRIYEALEAQEKIVIYSDYDCDGIPGAVLLFDFFKKINYTNVSVYIPDRHSEGYGLHTEAVKRFVEEKVSLLITIDLGISNNESIAQATASGITVIVTDHHEPPEELPRAYALVNPKLGSYPDTMLCGAGVAFKLVQALLKKYRAVWGIHEGWEKWLLDMAGLATLSDMVPLVNENRTLAYFGLKVIARNKRLGLQALFDELMLDPARLTEDDITFMVTPRINAASRMDTPLRAFELLSSDNLAQAKERAKLLAGINDERKIHVANAMKEVHTVLGKREEVPIIVIGNINWRVGVLGLIASKIVEHYNKPAFVWGMEGSTTIKGSCRSDGSIDVVTLMRASQKVFLDFGGHILAGGFSINHESIHLLESALLENHHQALREGSENNAVYFPMQLSEVTTRTYELVASLAPFGLGNEKPVFAFSDVVIASVKQFGKEKNHLELLLSDTKIKVKAIAFFSDKNSFSVEAKEGATCTVAATLEQSFFRGKRELRLRIVDIL